METVIGPINATTMRLDGGHPALELVNTIYGQVGGPVEHDVLGAPDDLVTFARRLGFAGAATPPSGEALGAALRLRAALDRALRALLAGEARPGDELREIAVAAQAALGAAHLTGAEGPALAWTWPEADPFTPVHRLAHAAAELLTDAEALSVLSCCDACCWLFLDRSRGAGRRWCSMADCGTEAKKRRYVQRRRERRARERGAPQRASA